MSIKAESPEPKVPVAGVPMSETNLMGVPPTDSKRAGDSVDGDAGDRSRGFGREPVEPWSVLPHDGETHTHSVLPPSTGEEIELKPGSGVASGMVAHEAALETASKLLDAASATPPVEPAPAVPLLVL